MIRISCRLLLLSLICFILLYDCVESKRGGSSGSKGSSGSRSSSRGSSSSGSKSSWFGGGSSSSSRSSSSSSFSWGGGGSRSHSSSGGSSRSYGSPSYGSSGRGWSNRYSGNTFVVVRTHTYYRGGGGYGAVYGGYSSRTGSSASSTPAAQQPRESPTVTTEMIMDALFPGNPRVPSKEIFNYTDNPLRRRHDMNGNLIGKKKDDLRDASMDGLMMGLLVNAQRSEEGKEKDLMLKMSDAYIASTKDEEVNIMDEQAPMLVRSIPYFWGDGNLPQGDNGTDCVDFSPVNDPSNITICNVSSMIRCKRTLTGVTLLGKKQKSFLDNSFSFGSDNMVDEKVVIKTGNGTIVDEFSWFCPPTNICCEWECCSTENKQYTEYDPPDEDFRASIHMLVFFGFVAGVILICCCCYHGSRVWINDNAVDGRRPQQAPERQPLTADYPRQPPTNPPGGHYGWHLEPTAPPAYKE